MSMHIYNRCCQFHGEVVKVRQMDGFVHVGRITRVTPSRVWLQPVRGGLGYGFYGGYGGFGFGVPIALSFIAGIALAGAFW
ncbi:hypothetical protein [Tenuibacillus multivorans]|uniref:Uncharacterized protein n=1 Tax=Tenuibacillus multivorans TaxID=237069 RepID=A0A1H0DD49_9BACI|nr:hypothetical protein [Tenuibacillus multivorans]GEL76607.1 hypothetical protein TMU01_08420 [Tenuibacillus multivorans]SDN67916.1 hypothetical protein SAMN05216498_2817 [Tenuibacillus multivorans]